MNQGRAEWEHGGWKALYLHVCIYCMCVCAFFCVKFSNQAACNQMHFPPNCQKWRMNQSRAAWEQGGLRVRRKIGGGRLKVRDQKNGCSFCCVHSKHMLHTRYDSLRSLPRCLIGVEKEFFFLFSWSIMWTQACTIATLKLLCIEGHDHISAIYNMYNCTLLRSNAGLFYSLTAFDAK